MNRVDVYRRLSADLAVWSNTRCSEAMLVTEYIHTGEVLLPLYGATL
jgi:hypothetical protein